MSSEIVPIPPPVLWAQTKGQVFLTINVECEKPDIQIENKKVCFKGKGFINHKHYEVEIPLYAEIDPEKSTNVNKGRLIEVVLAKAEEDDTFWPRLTSDKTKHHWIRVDFNRWQDDVEDDDKYEQDMFSSDCNIDYDSCDEEDLSEGQETIPSP